MEMERLQIDVLDQAEVRWTESGMVDKGKCEVIFSGGKKNEHGIGITMTKKVSKALQGFLPISDRVIRVKFEGKPVIIVQLYVPTNDHSDDEIEEFYADVKKALKQVESGDILIVMGDMNAKIGKEKYGRVVGKYGLGERN